MTNLRHFGHDDLKQLVGISSLERSEQWVNPITYRVLDSREQTLIQSAVRDEVQNRAWRVSGDNDPSVWERGWDEIARRVKSLDQIDAFALSPNYFRGENIFRLHDQYVQAVSTDAEFAIGLMIREAVLAHWVGPYPEVVEFGCGTGLNLFLLAKRFPEKQYTGCDWALSVWPILQCISNTLAVRLDFRQYNMLTGSGLIEPFRDGTVICTVHAMEQLHVTWGPFVRDILRRRPALCVHIEPFVELYSCESRLDEVAIQFHQKRQYLSGFLPALREYQAREEIVILDCRRIHFGGKYHEAYSIVAWKPA